MKAHISDHALVRFMERTGAADPAPLKNMIAASIDRAFQAAMALKLSDCLIIADGLVYVLRDGVVTTILKDEGIRARASQHFRREGRQD
ncbi:MAG: hypothetical protein KGJ57_18305 [Sphingomonadales bacterium]|nr:hypothetical protein [Sphingomonadales bacterium]MDE2171352.1 hypothetical protein [Sphingomonadales bacterium]